jgi:hypothetical protein
MFYRSPEYDNRCIETVERCCLWCEDGIGFSSIHREGNGVIDRTHLLHDKDAQPSTRITVKLVVVVGRDHDVRRNEFKTVGYLIETEPSYFERGKRGARFSDGCRCFTNVVELE